MDWQRETAEHISKVAEFIYLIVNELLKRAASHDIAKLHEPEAPIFAEFTPLLHKSKYGSNEYKQFLRRMQPALEHHYELYSHHPEHFENGVSGMTLVDLIEMFCDWKAASMRHEDGDIQRSIDLNIERFDLSPQLSAILRNTITLFEQNG